MATGLLLDARFEAHDTGPGHPESPARLKAVAKGLSNGKWTEQLIAIEARPATFEELCLVHDPAYVALVKREVEDHGSRRLSTGDTEVSLDSYDVARLATGGVLNAVDAVMEGRLSNAFCAVRPPGHHAPAAQGMGFCIFNHVAVAARYAQRKHGIERVVIVDWDVHHGNGTQDIFFEDGTVFYFSTHQHPLYPGTGLKTDTGAGEGQGTTLNCPFPAGTMIEPIREAFRHRLLPAMASFRPDLVLISAGFDGRHGDPLGRFMLRDEDFAELTKILMDLADQSCGGRIVSVLEGGYDLTGLGLAVAAHVGTLAGV
jgi:acetoin utilization deacetylase AcuC-like enzyme